MIYSIFSFLKKIYLKIHSIPNTYIAHSCYSQVKGYKFNLTTLEFIYVLDFTPLATFYSDVDLSIISISCFDEKKKKKKKERNPSGTKPSETIGM